MGSSEISRKKVKVLERNDVKLVLPSSLQNLTLIRALAKTYFESQNIEKGDVMKLLSVIDELATNVVEHGYRYETGEMTIFLKKIGNTVYVSIEDNGHGYDEKNSSKEEGGMGLFIVKGMVDEFNVEKKETGTKFNVSKEVKEAK